MKRLLAASLLVALLGGCARAPRREPVKPLEVQRPDFVFHRGTGGETPQPFAVKPIADLWRFYPAGMGLGDVVVQGDRVWVASGGLHVFDGPSGRWVQTLTAGDGLPGSFLQTLLLDGDRLWVNSAEEGIGWLNTRTGEVGRKNSGRVLNMASAAGSVFFWVGQQIMRYDKAADTWDAGGWPSGAGSVSETTAVRRMVTRGDEVWVATRTHLARFEPDAAKWRWTKVLPLGEARKGARFLQGLCVGDDAVWLWYSGFWSYRMRPEEERPSREATAESWRGLSSNSGVIRFGKSDGKMRVYTTSDGLASNVVDRMISVDGAIWALCLPETSEDGTRFVEGGLSRYDPEDDRWVSYPKVNGKPARYVTCAVEADGALWAAFPEYDAVLASWLERRMGWGPARRQAMVNTTGLVVARYNAGDDTWSTWRQAGDAPPQGLLKSGETVLVAAGAQAGGRSPSGRLVRGAALYALDLRSGQWRQVAQKESGFRPMALRANDGSLWVAEEKGIHRFNEEQAGESPVLTPSRALPGAPAEIATAGGTIWAAVGGEEYAFLTPQPRRLVRLMPSGEWSPVPDAPRDVWAIDGDEAGDLWVVSTPSREGGRALELSRFDGQAWRAWPWRHVSPPPEWSPYWAEMFAEDIPIPRVWYRLLATSRSQWIVGAGIPGVLERHGGGWTVHRVSDLQYRSWQWDGRRLRHPFAIYRDRPAVLAEGGGLVYAAGAEEPAERLSFEEPIYGLLALGKRLVVRQRDGLTLIGPQGERRTIAVGALRYGATLGTWRREPGEPPPETIQPRGPDGSPMASDGENVWVGVPGALVRVNLETGAYLAISSLAGLPVEPEQIAVSDGTVWVSGRAGIAALATSRLPGMPGGAVGRK